MPRPGYLDLTLGEFLDQVAARVPAPGGGAVAAVSVAMAAGLAAMAARFSGDHLERAEAVAAQAETLRQRVAPLADADAEAYQKVIDAFARPREPGTEAGELRRQTIRRALEGAAEVPLRMAEVAAEVAELAATIANGGNPNLRGDAVTAALLAAAGARSAANLVDINVGDRDQRALRAARLAGAADDAAGRAVRLSASGR
jgi:formiminotetrahydrofolate cyclodeaminase